jgi:hypothetical protein
VDLGGLLVEVTGHVDEDRTIGSQIHRAFVTTRLPITRHATARPRAEEHEVQRVIPR